MLAIGSRYGVVARLMPFCFALALAGCMSGSSGGSTTAAAPKAAYQASDFIRPSYCPPVMIRGGTAALAVYDKGHDNDAAFVRYQASIATTARQCTVSGTTLTAKVGVAGRVVGGPKAAAGTVTIPIRVVVVKQVGGTGPLYSQLFKVPVVLSRPGFRGELRPGL